MNKKIIMSFLLIIFIISGCSYKQADMEGIVIEVYEEKILIARNLSRQKYNKLKSESKTSLRDLDVLGEIESLNLYEITYNKSKSFNEGDYVEVWIKGPILSSYPAQTKAQKINLKE